ncbi:MAG: Stealth CR1 domain-containing protein [Bacilli bacterium]|nr:Stealth CR1 domain-containing protein [Bacilli bacterium]
MKNEKIDFVITWVDDRDQTWLKERHKYAKKYDNIDNRDIRFRNYDTLKYWFRAVEKNAPWVNKIHFITSGHLPEWINTKNPKLHIVKHADYMPSDALPTFNSNAIELKIHEIKGLSEQFVLFNDDMFLLKKVSKKDFFKKGIPCNTMALAPIIPFPGDQFYQMLANNMEIINKYFNYHDYKKKNLLKILSLKQGKYLLKTLPFLIYNKYPGFTNFHVCNSFLKSTFKEVWQKESNMLNQTVYSKFRNNHDNVSQWLFNYWQYASGKFYQRNYHFGININIDNKKAIKIIKKRQYKFICLSDCEYQKDYNLVKEAITDAFEKIYPDKSEFEI